MMKNQRRSGVTGILRVKNDASFVFGCVESCIPALDELVIVYNDCEDGSEIEIERARQKYPHKIRVYEYPFHVLGAGLTKEQYEKACSMDDDSPNLLSNYYNFALEKVRTEYALKIDADQIYFTDKLKEWCEFCRTVQPRKFSVICFIGLLFQLYLTIFRYASLKLKRVLSIMPAWLVGFCYPAYIEYTKYLFSRGKACLSMSGINVVKDGDWYVSLGRVSEKMNILPPFNGEGDHVIFKVTDRTFYRRFMMQYYNLQRSSSYSLIEEFVHPYRIMFVGYFWQHICAMRPNMVAHVQSLRKDSPDAFERMDNFLGWNYDTILRRSDHTMFTLFQRILFSFVYKANIGSLRLSLQNGNGKSQS